MTFERAERAAELRGITLLPKAWVGNMVGCGYEMYGDVLHPRHFYCDTLDGAYRIIMEHPKEVRNG